MEFKRCPSDATFLYLNRLVGSLTAKTRPISRKLRTFCRLA
jgi:hypothetical protein